MMDTNIINSLVREIQVNYARIREYLQKNEVTAYRLISPGSPWPVAIDIYQDNAVIHVFNRIQMEILTELEIALRETLLINRCFYKNRTKEDLALPVCASKTLLINENGHRFRVNLSDYQDTGLFLDHRETRRWLAPFCRGKSVLNTFAYTGSFTIYAAVAGALRTCSVDISRVYCEWIKENLTLNNLSPEKNWVFKMDTFEFFAYARKKQMVFDIIVIDPPTFSRNKNQSFSVQKDHPALINGALELLQPDGFILFSTNYREFRISSSDLLPCYIKPKNDTIPPDFAGLPPHLCFIISKNKESGAYLSEHRPVVV